MSSQKTAYDFFMSRGYSSAQSAGIVGNLIGESALNPQAVGDGGLAKGIAQHHPDRWAAHLSRTQAAGKDPFDLEAQLDFVDWELRNKETRAFNALMGAKTVDEATAAFIGFERPQGWTAAAPRNGHNYSGRLTGAQSVYAMFNGNAAPAPLTFSQTPSNAAGPPAPSYEVQSPAGVTPITPVSAYDQLELTRKEKAAQEENDLWTLTQAALRAAKARGQKLGGLRDATMRRNAAIQAKAKAEADRVMKVIGPLRRSGATLATIAATLNETGVPTSRGGTWTPTQVSRVLERVGDR